MQLAESRLGAILAKNSDIALLSQLIIGWRSSLLHSYYCYVTCQLCIWFVTCFGSDSNLISSYYLSGKQTLSFLQQNHRI